MPEIDIYPVGVLEEILYAYRAITRLGMWREAWTHVKRIPAMWGRRNAWNGYLAEPRDSSLCTRAGHGWTKRRALADLMRHMAEVADHA
ncbi:hypothetical protein [Nocardia otitidiscaviarum]|uniref:hypothetical protein n=1 Tax=Nocardia otitidiscaviarum TaxID=1823 RepID=UPI0004A70396|nr:hypothetical protein [Nocardia otitidiscaviarum]